MISAVILAAGKSTRLGLSKQLLEINGRTIIEHVIKNVCESTVAETIVVLGFMADKIIDKTRSCNIKIVLNRAYESGMSSSLRAGLKAVNKDADAVIFVLADQPLVKAPVLNKLISEYERKKPLIVVPTYKGKRGNPTLVDRALFNEIKRISGDVGARSLIEKYRKNVEEIEMNSPGVLIDIDTAEEFKLIKKRLYT